MPFDISMGFANGFAINIFGRAAARRVPLNNVNERGFYRRVWILFVFLVRVPLQNNLPWTVSWIFNETATATQRTQRTWMAGGKKTQWKVAHNGDAGCCCLIWLLCYSKFLSNELGGMDLFQIFSFCFRCSWGISVSSGCARVCVCWRCTDYTGWENWNVRVCLCVFNKADVESFENLKRYFVAISLLSATNSHSHTHTRTHSMFRPRRSRHFLFSFCWRRRNCKFSARDNFVGQM